MSYFHCGNGYPDRCNGYRGPLDTYVCTNPRHDESRTERRPAVADDERKSRIYAFLGDRTCQPDGSEWDHDRLRRLVNDLLEVI